MTLFYKKGWFYYTRNRNLV